LARARHGLGLCTNGYRGAFVRDSKDEQERRCCERGQPQIQVEDEHTDDPGVQPWKSGTQAAASFAGESLAASCVVPASDVGL